MVRARVILPALLAVAGLMWLAACTTLSPQVCQAGDWETIGQNDGVKGHKSGAFLDHQRACAKVDVTVDEAAWRKGYDAGLTTYCQPKTVYLAAKNGLRFPDVCERFKTDELQFAWDYGRRYWDLGRELDFARMDISSARRDAARGDVVLASDQVTLGWKVRNLRQEQLLYSRWPPL